MIIMTVIVISEPILFQKLPHLPALHKCFSSLETNYIHQGLSQLIGVLVSLGPCLLSAGSCISIIIILIALVLRVMLQAKSNPLYFTYRCDIQVCTTGARERCASLVIPGLLATDILSPAIPYASAV